MNQTDNRYDYVRAPLPANETERLEALRRYKILDTQAEQCFDDLTALASLICGAPISLLSLVDQDRQWFKSKVGTTTSETARDIAFCAHGILQPDVFIVPDAQLDARFAGNPMVTADPPVRFYAGAPLTTPDGQNIGMLCVNDTIPRELTDEQKRALQALARQAVAQLELRRQLAQLNQTQAQLLEISRQAGMAEVSTSVLHNVGNVLNSVNVTTLLLTDRVRVSKVVNCAKAAALMREHAGDLATFLTSDVKGRQLPGYLADLGQNLIEERAEILKELESLGHNVEHIKEIVAMQQSYSRVSGVVETLPVAMLVEDALRMNTASLGRHGVQIVRAFDEVPPVVVEKHKVLQILVNLIRNAKYALDESANPVHELTIRIRRDGDECVVIELQDNGVGIPAENLTQIFSHGFTTRKDGHGFGLHSGALAARELGGSLSVASDGPGTGATFTLKLPFQRTKGNQ